MPLSAIKHGLRLPSHKSHASSPSPFFMQADISLVATSVQEPAPADSTTGRRALMDGQQSSMLSALVQSLLGSLMPRGEELVKRHGFQAAVHHPVHQPSSAHALQMHLERVRQAMYSVSACMSFIENQSSHVLSYAHYVNTYKSVSNSISVSLGP